MKNTSFLAAFKNSTAFINLFPSALKYNIFMQQIRHSSIHHVLSNSSETNVKVCRSFSRISCQFCSIFVYFWWVYSPFSCKDQRYSYYPTPHGIEPPFWNFIFWASRSSRWLTFISSHVGFDGISGWLLKECSDEICDSLTKLFNKSLRTGVVPTEWKIANIIPLYKNGGKSYIENNRPISLLSLVSKTLQRCVLKQLLLRVRHLIHQNQHGFLPGKSCTTHLLATFNNIGSRLDKGEEIDIFCKDMSKAFDRVNHKLLLVKLKHIE